MIDTELGGLLDKLGRQRFIVCEFDAAMGEARVTAAVYEYHGAGADVFIMRSAEIAHAFRTGPGVYGDDRFSPPWVSWSYTSCPVWTLRALLTLAPPGHPDAPREQMILPPGFALTGQERAGKMRVRVRLH
jgi:hypothetical protein